MIANNRKFDVCLISHGQPSSNPRLIRDADALAEEGLNVCVVTPRIMERWVKHDIALLSRAKWHYKYVNCLGTFNARAMFQFFRFRHKFSKFFLRFASSPWLVSHAANYANRELAKIAAASQAYLYIAHQHHALPAAANAARKTRGAMSFDAEDLLSDCSSEPTELMRQIEKLYLKECTYVSTMSSAASARLQETNNLPLAPLVLHNTPSISEREGILPPNRRRSNTVPSLYWFGQSIGTHSCAEVALRAISLMKKPLRLVLRGHPVEEYVSSLREISKTLKIENRLEILPVSGPDSMVRLAAEHDFLLGTQPGAELFHQMAIGNKVFTGLMAGLGLVLSNTIAHKKLLHDTKGVGVLFANSSPEALAKMLDGILDSPDELLQMKQSAWRVAELKYNWEVESRGLTEIVKSTLIQKHGG